MPLGDRSGDGQAVREETTTAGDVPAMRTLLRFPRLLGLSLLFAAFQLFWGVMQELRLLPSRSWEPLEVLLACCAAWLGSSLVLVGYRFPRLHQVTATLGLMIGICAAAGIEGLISLPPRLSALLWGFPGMAVGEQLQWVLWS